MVTFPEAIRLFFTRYVDFQGRSRRSEYWWVALFNVIVFGVGLVLAMTIGGMNFETGEMGPLGYLIIGLLVIYSLGILIPSIALFVRRLHDINQTGWIYLGLLLLGFVPLIGLLASIAQIVIACIPGTVGPNKYGEDPKNPGGSPDVFI